MRYLVVIAVGLLLASPAWADFEIDKRDCVRGKGSVKISGCSRLLKLEKLDPKSRATAYFYRGNGYYFLKQYRRAIQDYNEAIRLNPRYAVAYANRGSAYGDLKQYPRAIQDQTEAIRLIPGFALAYYNRGSTYDDLKQYRRAIQDYNKAIRLNPRYAIAYGNRGVAFERLGRRKEAIRDYRQALRLDPGQRQSRTNLRRLGVRP